MRKSIAFALAIAGVGSAAYYLPEAAPIRALRDDLAAVAGSGPKSAPTPPPLASAAPNTTPRTFSPTQPLLAAPTGNIDTAAKAQDAKAPLAVPAQPSAVAAKQTPATVAAPIAPLVEPTVRRLSSSRPADDDARQELVKDLQRELKRVGCYDGEINGTWSPASKRAMASFTERVNATLPLDEPDYILLTLIQGHNAQACGQGCPAGQGMGESGKCTPRAILAQSARRSGEKSVAERLEPSTAAPESQTSAPRKREPATGNTNKAMTSGWSTVVTTVPQPQAGVTEVARAAASPLPGRMAIGAGAADPTALTADSERAKADLAKRKADLTAAAAAQRTAEANSERLARLAAVQAAKDKEALALKRAQTDAAVRNSQAAITSRTGTTVAALAPVNPAATRAGNTTPTDDDEARKTSTVAPTRQSPDKPRVKEAPRRSPVVNSVNQPQPLLPPANQPAARRMPPPYAVGAPVYVVAPRPAYAPAPTRWTRSIFTDVSRMMR